MRAQDGREREVLVLDVPDWVNVIALAGEEVILVRQWRFGTGDFTLEIPGGLVENGEEHGIAAQRELLEETGYRAEDWRHLGWVEPNPAIQNNRCHTWVARGAVWQQEPQGDGDEEIEVLRRPLEEIGRLIAGGSIRHSLVVAAFQLFGSQR